MAQLLGGVEIEFLPGQGKDGGLLLPDAGGEHFAEFPQGLLVHQEAGALHLREHRAQGKVDVG